MAVYNPRMALTSSITEYDDRWPMQFDREAKRLCPVFESALVGIHHVGSTAVVGLSAKPEIDVLVTVANTIFLDRWKRALDGLGYKPGKDLQAGHHFFKRDVDGVRTHKLHVCQNEHPQIQRMLGIRDHLRENREDRIAYQNLKLHLEQENEHGIAEYIEGKAPFLDSLFHKVQSKG